MAHQATVADSASCRLALLLGAAVQHLGNLAELVGEDRILTSRTRSTLQYQRCRRSPGRRAAPGPIQRNPEMPSAFEVVNILGGEADSGTHWKFPALIGIGAMRVRTAAAGSSIPMSRPPSMWMI